VVDFFAVIFGMPIAVLGLQHGAATCADSKKFRQGDCCMATTLVRGGAVISSGVPAVRELSLIERYVVRSSHPVSLYFQAIGLIWFVFFFWNHLWVEAILSYVICRFIGALAVSRTDTKSLGKVLLGRLALLHLHGSNFIVQLAGTVVLLYGIWLHETRVVLAGISLVLLGHVQGWDRVDSRLKTD
jgi:hypothetical protein